jgi:hypothetical protein
MLVLFSLEGAGGHRLLDSKFAVSDVWMLPIPGMKDMTRDDDRRSDAGSRDSGRPLSAVSCGIRAAVSAVETFIAAVARGPAPARSGISNPAGARRAHVDDAHSGMKVQHERLVYELLDAHADTVQLASDLAHEEQWAVHLEYLRGLQRTGYEVLASIQTETDR